MSDWIKDKAAAIKRQEEETARQREWQLHAHRLIEERWPDVWTAILPTLRADVETFNAQFPLAPDRHIAIEAFANAPETITFKREESNTTHVVRLRAAAAGVKIQVIVTDARQQQSTREETLPFTCTDAGVVGLQAGARTGESIAQVLLRHLF